MIFDDKSSRSWRIPWIWPRDLASPSIRPGSWGHSSASPGDWRPDPRPGRFTDFIMKYISLIYIYIYIYYVCIYVYVYVLYICIYTCTLWPLCEYHILTRRRRRIPKTNSEDALAEDGLKPEDDFPPEDEFRRRIGRRRNNFSVGQRKLFHGVVPWCLHP